ncbi:hypothetical protein, partial [Burkholderia cenocepacia]
MLTDQRIGVLRRPDSTVAAGSVSLMPMFLSMVPWDSSSTSATIRSCGVDRPALGEGRHRLAVKRLRLFEPPAVTQKH